MSYLPFDLMTNDTAGKRRLKTEAATRTETKIGDGGFFVGASRRFDVPSPSVYSSVLAAGAGGVVIEDLLVTINFGNLTDGHINITVLAYVESSNGNSWAYTSVGAITPAGRSVNTNYINTLPLTTIDSGVTVDTLTGAADYPLYFVDYLIDTSANRNTLSMDRSEFFTGDRKIVIGADEKVLIQTVITGDGAGAVDLSSIFFMSEPLN